MAQARPLSTHQSKEENHQSHREGNSEKTKILQEQNLQNEHENFTVEYKWSPK